MATHVWHAGTHLRSSRLDATTPASSRVDGAAVDAGRLIFGGFFLYSGINHLMQMSSMAVYAGAKGVPFPELAVAGTGLLLIAGSLCLLTRWPRLGAWMIVAFLVGVTPVMHAFWNDAAGPERNGDIANFTKNAALMGAALIFAGMPVPWPTRWLTGHPAEVPEG
jgi:uncharacterized membrane protein YphA (DoxX/SURF4 family)